jgi:hypothetical protein
VSAYTPGPWRFVPWHIEEGPPAVRCAEGWIVATTAKDEDARLIADAPVMREAIDDIRRVMERHERGEANANFVVGWVRGALKRLEDQRS